jgi:hypothetical protein
MISLSLLPEIDKDPSLMLVSLNTATGNSSGMSIAKVSLPIEYTSAALKVPARLLITSIAAPSSAIVTFNVNLRSLIAVPDAKPISCCLVPVKSPKGLCLNDPSASPSTP